MYLLADRICVHYSGSETSLESQLSVGNENVKAHIKILYRFLGDLESMWTPIGLPSPNYCHKVGSIQLYAPGLLIQQQCLISLMDRSPQPSFKSLSRRVQRVRLKHRAAHFLNFFLKGCSASISICDGKKSIYFCPYSACHVYLDHFQTDEAVLPPKSGPLMKLSASCFKNPVLRNTV